jgi:hypothetical protein
LSLFPFFLPSFLPTDLIVVQEDACTMHTLA